MRVLKQQEQQQNYTNDEENIVIYVIQGRKITHTHKIYTSLTNLVFGSRSCHISFISSGCLVVNGRYCQNVRIAFVRIFNNPGHDRERPRERDWSKE